MVSLKCEKLALNARLISYKHGHNRVTAPDLIKTDTSICFHMSNIKWDKKIAL